MDGNFFSNLEKFKLPIALTLVGMVLIIGGMVISGKSSVAPKEFPKESLTSSDKLISVDVSGAVEKEGVYKLNQGARIEEAIAAAGGFSADANSEYISKYLNMAQKLIDGSKIYIPLAGETVSAVQSAPASGGVAGINNAVNINTATQSELESLDGIGTVRASDIISGRPYQKIEELVDRKIIGKGIFENIKDSIVVY